MHEVLILWYYGTYMLFYCDGYNFKEVRIYIPTYAKWYYFCRKVSVNARNYFCRKVSVNARKLKKWGKRECDFSSLVFHVSHPNCPLSLSDFAAPKVFSLFYFPGCIRPESPALFSYSFFFVFAFFSLCSYTAAFPLSPKQNIPL